VSSEEQEKEGYSIPSQQKLLRTYAHARNFDVVREFVDVETAKRAGRTGFGEMLAFLKRSASCRTILVEKTDRLYRNLKDYVTLDEFDLEIHFVKENFVLSRDSRSTEKFMHGIKVLMAKNYVDNLGEEVRKGLLEKAEQGIPPYRVGLGYRNVEGTNGRRTIEPDPVTAPIVRRMFEDYATGKYSLAELAEMAKSEGLFAGRETDRVTATIHLILTNPFYYGEFRHRDKLFRGVYLPLVSRDLWEKVQATLKERGTRKPRRMTHDLAFSNLVRCGHCGCALVGEIKKGRYVYYHCTGYKGKCPEPYVREEVLEAKFSEILRCLTFDDEVLGWVKEALRQSHVDERQFHRDAIERLQAEYNRLQRRVESAYEDKLDGRIGAAFFDQKAGEWRAEQERIERAIQDHRQADQSYMEEGLALLELAGRAADLFEKQVPGEKRRLLDFVLSNSTWANGVLTPVFRQPFDLLADAAAMTRCKMAAGTLPEGLHQGELPGQDSNLEKQDQNLL
jgi:site-specific DNA recombinase